MDRLEEANKVASLMRRRENPKQIPVAKLMVSAVPEYRALQEPAAFPARAEEARFKPLALAQFPARVVEIPERFSSPLAELGRRCAAADNRIMTAESLPFVQRGSSQPVLGASKVKCLPSGLRRAGLTALRDSAIAAEEEMREFGAALHVTRTPVLPTGHFSFEFPPHQNLGRTTDLQPLAAAPAWISDADQRISESAPFEKRRPAMPSQEVRLGPVGELVSSRPPQSDPPAAMELPVAERLCSVPRVEMDARLPRLRAQPVIGSTRQGEAVELQAAGYDSPLLAVARHLRVPWKIADPVIEANARRSSFHGSLGCHDPLPFDPSCNGGSTYRTAEVRFLPGESTFDVTMDLHGSLGPGGPEAAAVPIEEHFNSGMEQWQGDISRWRLDAAGARPAGLALLRPTLALSDYDFEFFTRIEARAVTFVFRASNTSNYHKVSIAMVESGRYELQRRAVIGGVEEPASVAPLPGVLRPGAAFTVRTQAHQNDFSIWLDGELAARWTDGRLPVGGIGFVAPRDDRARIYWVRISPLDAIHSPAALPRPARSVQ
jgi:hypothetical protein